MLFITLLIILIALVASDQQMRIIPNEEDGDDQFLEIGKNAIDNENAMEDEPIVTLLEEEEERQVDQPVHAHAEEEDEEAYDDTDHDQCSPSDRSMYIEHERPFAGPLIGRPHALASLDVCAMQCVRTPHCAGANFLLDLRGEPVCTLHVATHDARATSSAGNAETPLVVMFGMHSFCLPRNRTGTCSAPWTFQKFARVNLIHDDVSMVLAENAGSLQDCLQTCHQSPDCAGALYSEHLRHCRLTRASPQRVHGVRAHFRHDPQWDAYELNCVRQVLNPTRCAFPRINQAGFTTPFTTLLHDTRTPDACESACRSTLRATATEGVTMCRAWTHDANTSRCYLSHLALRALGRNVLEQTDAGLTSAEVDECIDFKLDCRADSLLLTGRSPLKLFRGRIGPAKTQGACMQRVDPPTHTFRVTLPFAECGFAQRSESDDALVQHSATLLVKEASTELITSRDKVVKVTCRLHRKPAPSAGNMLNLRFRFHNETYSGTEDDDAETPVAEVGAVPVDDRPQHVHTRVVVLPERKTVAQRQHHTVEGPAYRLEVLDEFGAPVHRVELGKPGFLEIRRHNPEKFDGDGGLLLTELVALDTAHPHQTARLIGPDGCVSNATMVTSIQRMDPNRLRVGIRFNGFGDKSRVSYQALVKRCQYGCALDCNRRLYLGPDALPPEAEEEEDEDNAQPTRNAIRKRRALPGPASVNRHFHLQDDLWSTRSTQVQVMLMQVDLHPEARACRRVPLAVLLLFLIVICAFLLLRACMIRIRGRGRK